LPPNDRSNEIQAGIENEKHDERLDWQASEEEEKNKGDKCGGQTELRNTNERHGPDGGGSFRED